MQFKTFIQLTAVAGAVAFGSTGCTTSVGDIDRTQPDLLSKSDFDGKWYVRQSVIEVPETSAASFVGDMRDMELIVWEIQEDRLVGYRAYEQIPGGNDEAVSEEARPGEVPVADGQGDGRDPTVYKDNPIISFPITEHVDVQREYNPRTGEQTNVISENTSDRPWYERDYIRVEWSNNEVFNFFMFSDDADFASFIPENEGGRDRFYSERNEDDELTYFDVTDRRVVSPNINVCAAYANNNEIGDCTADEIKVRTSLLKADPDREQEYVPLVYDEKRQGEFGYFRIIRPTYDRGRGNTYTGLINLANRFDIWETSRDSDGDPLPYAERTLASFTFTLSPNFPSDLIPVAEQIAGEYDATFKRTARTARGQDADAFDDDLKKDTGGDCLFCLDTNESGEARIGDLRRNFIYWVDDPQMVGPLGYGPSSGNPETGRLVSAAAYVYGAGIDRQAELAVDVIRLLNDELDEEDIIDGQYIRDAVRHSLAAIDPRVGEDMAQLETGQLTEKLLGAKGVQRLEQLKLDGLPAAAPGWEEARLKLVQGSPIEELAIAPEMHDLFDPHNVLGQQLQDSAQSPDDSALGPLSIANWGTKSKLQGLNDIQTRASERNLWLRDFSDPAVIGLARQLQEEGLTEDQIRQRMREEIFRAVMLHEVGHTVGLRHNFGGSADSLNYGDKYWELRDKTIQPVISPFGGVTTDGLLASNCALESSDAISAACEEQRNGRMSEHQYSSIMDYGSRFNSDFHGLGMYDEAAIAAGYGDLVEVFDEDVTDNLGTLTSGGQSYSIRDLVQASNQRLSPILRQGVDNALGIHYTQFPYFFGGVEKINNRRWIPRADYDPEADSGPVKVPYLACYDEYVDSVETCHRWDNGADAYEITSDYISRYKEYYVFHNFQRDQVGFSGFDVFQRVATRYLLPLTNMYQHWLFNSFSRPSNSPAGELALLAMIEGFYTNWNVIGTPSYGSYVQDDEGNFRQVSFDMDVTDTDLTIPRGDGRRQYSQFDWEEGGYSVFRRVTESGHYYDQLAALIALTSNDASVVGVGSDVEADVLRFSIPYFLVFGEDLENLFSGVFREDYQLFGAQVRNGKLARRSVFDLLSTEEPEVDGVVVPSISWSTRILSMMYGMAFLQSNYDTTFMQKGQIRLVGSAEDFDVSDDFEKVTVSNPSSGRVYVAHRRIDGTNGPWFGAELLSDAKEIVDQYQEIMDEERAAAEEDGRDVEEPDEAASLRFDFEDKFLDIELLRQLYSVYSISL